MKSGAVDAALIEAPYNVMLEREGFRQILFVGDLIPLPLAGLGTTLEKIRKQPDEVQRLVRATLRRIHYARSNKQESVKAIMDWADMDRPRAEEVLIWPSPVGQIAARPIRKAFSSPWKKSRWNRNSTRCPTPPRRSTGVSYNA